MAKSSTSWKPGQSGNLSGRPKLITEVRDLAREHTERAISRLVELMETDAGTTAAAACRELLDRAWGRAPQHIDQTIDQTNRNEDARAYAPDLEEMMARLREARAGLSHGGGQEAPQEAEPHVADEGDQPSAGKRPQLVN